MDGTVGITASESATGVVVSYSPVASACGTRVLWDGGNAIDAAVATALALTVTYPQAGNLGGGGFMLFAQKSGGIHCLDYRETAPRKTEERDFLDADGKRNDKSRKGAHAVGVPGTVAGLGEMLERFGSFKWDRIVAPIIDMADRGDVLTTRQTTYLKKYEADLLEHESTRRCFGVLGKQMLPGTSLVLNGLSQTLRTLADRGPRDFYTGTLAQQIAAEMERGGGPLDLQDLAEYKVRWRDALHFRYAGRDIYSAHLPSGGGLVVCLAMRLLDAGGYERMSESSPERYVLLARALRSAFAIRQHVAGDPDFMTPAEIADVEKLLERARHRGELEKIEKEFVFEGKAPGPRPSCTTHFCVIDKWGNAVSNTYSLNTLFGSKLVVGGAGFLLNNSIDDFRIGEGVANWYGIVDGQRNRLTPGRRPVTSMSPTIVRNDGVVELVLGASGGPMIPSVVLQVMLAVLGDKRRLPEAMWLPRIHHQYQRAEVQVEDNLGANVLSELLALGDPVVKTPRLAICAALHQDPKTRRIVGMLDPRFGQFR